MTKVRASGAQVCARCGARADARRGATPMCLSCGQPFPAATGGAGGAGTGGVLPIVIGLIVVGCVASASIAFVIGRRSNTGAEAPAAVDAGSSAPVLAPVTTPDVDAAASAKVPVPLSDAERDELAGSYTCAMDDTPAFPCRVAGGQLEKLAGSQRFRGAIRKLPSGDLQFAGTFFCPFGDCTRPVAATFVRKSPGRYVGQFGPSTSGGPGNERVVLVKVR